MLALTLVGAVGGAVLARAAYRRAGRRADWLLSAVWVAAVLAAVLLRQYGAVSRVAAGVTVGLALVSVGHLVLGRSRRTWGAPRPGDRRRDS